MPGMTRGFWRDRERYLETYWSRFPGIWVHGDWAIVDADGYWFIQGRSRRHAQGRRQAGRAGRGRVSAAVAHPAVLEAAAIGVPHEVKGEVIVVFCVLGPRRDRLGPELRAAIAGARGRVARQGAQARGGVVVVRALPKTRTGKVMRRSRAPPTSASTRATSPSLDDPLTVEAIRAAAPPRG